MIITSRDVSSTTPVVGGTSPDPKGEDMADDDEATRQKAHQLDVYEVTDDRGNVTTIKLTAEQAKERGGKKISGTRASRDVSTKARKPTDK